MSGTAVATLPTSSDWEQWSPDESALVEAAGLVHMDAQTGQKILAERPVVAAFLQHWSRTGLDPIARQIYAIARKSKGQLKWQIQISIDGARLVAERSGKYEGQTTPEFTGDGVTWTQVWLSKEHPAAARVGVYRAGFREPLYAVALWDAYVQTKFGGDVSDMWAKMGPLMLAKCAEMLALRKAFPQDLSGLYSAEEMDQAAPASAPSSPAEQREVRPALAAGDTRPITGQVAEPVATAWDGLRARIDACVTRPEFEALVSSLPPSVIGREIPGDPKGRKVSDYLTHTWSKLPAVDVVTGEVEDPEPPADDATVTQDAPPVTEWPVTRVPGSDAPEGRTGRGSCRTGTGCTRM
jgi:phage recombination protein Bet